MDKFSCQFLLKKLDEESIEVQFIFLIQSLKCYFFRCGVLLKNKLKNKRF